MKKLIITVALFLALGAIARRVASELGNVDWEQRFKALPDNAPPKWMFRNISEIHDNTERILTLVENREAVPAAGEMV